jgi:hypothetical protein
MEAKNVSELTELTAALRTIVIREYDRYCQAADQGPCGAIALALQHFGFGQEASVFAVSAVEREDCEDLEGIFSDAPKGRVCLPHYVVVTPSRQILDVALPPDFNLVGYAHLNVEPLAEFFYDEQECQFWCDVLRPVISSTS